MTLALQNHQRDEDTDSIAGDPSARKSTDTDPRNAVEAFERVLISYWSYAILPEILGLRDLETLYFRESCLRPSHIIVWKHSKQF